MTMNRKWLIALVFAFVATGCFGERKLTPFDPADQQLGVVMEFGYKASNKADQSIADSFAGRLSQALFDTKRLKVIDRERLKSALKELQLPVGIPLDSSQIATVCKQLKAKVAVYGDIITVQREQAQRGSRIIEKLLVTVDAKLVLADTAEILSRGEATGRAVIRYKPASKPPDEVLVNAALTNAAKQVARQLVIDLQPK
jgi:hypothetical protein